MDLRVLMEPNIDLPRLSQVLDELGHPGRVWATQAWGRGLQARLYEAAKGFRKVTLDDYVPPGTAPLVEVIHHGKNTLPMHTHFQKRFCKPRAEDAVLVGYNHQSWSGITGPGYFVTHLSPSEGEVDIDYTMVPKEKPDAWPAIVPNSAKLGRFVYDGMIDVMRGISTHVSIGRAKKPKKQRPQKNEAEKNDEGWMDAWFVLVREDPAPPST